MVPSTLLVVIDPTSDEQPSLARAQQIAQQSGAALHLFCCDYTEDLKKYRSRKDAKQTVMDRVRSQLDALAAPLKEAGLEVTTESYWNQDWRQAIVKACGRAGADIVVKSSFSHSKLKRRLKDTSDISLLRNAPCATLLVKDSAPWKHNRLLAALSLEDDDIGHEELNRSVIAQAQRLKRATHGELHVVSAFDDARERDQALSTLMEQEEADSGEEAIGQVYGVNADRVHLQTGSAAKTIVNACAELQADAVVIGTVARKGLSAALIGNTAEKIIDRLDADILVVN